MSKLIQNLLEKYTKELIKIYGSHLQEVILYGSFPELSIWIGSFGFSALVFIVGLLIFRKLQRDFILYV